MPENQYFYPQRRIFRSCADLDEVEAIRLSDYEALEQENAAENMNLQRYFSENTCSRIKLQMH